MHGDSMTGWTWFGMAACVIVIIGLVGLSLWALSRGRTSSHELPQAHERDTP
jgi:hypothetical protein